MQTRILYTSIFGSVNNIFLSVAGHGHSENGLSPIRLYRQTSNMSRTVGGNEIADHLDVVGALPAPTTSSFSA